MADSTLLSNYESFIRRIDRYRKLNASEIYNLLMTDKPIIVAHMKTTLGKTIRTARKWHRYTYRALCEILSYEGQSIDRNLLWKIECDLVDLRSSEYDWLVWRLAVVLDLDETWLETLRQTPEVRISREQVLAETTSAHIVKTISY